VCTLADFFLGAVFFLGAAFFLGAFETNNEPVSHQGIMHDKSNSLSTLTAFFFGAALGVFGAAFFFGADLSDANEIKVSHIKM